MRPLRKVGIVGYGAYIPCYRLPAAEVARVWQDGGAGVPIKEKAVPGLDEDTATMAIEAARNALSRAQVDPSEIRAVWVGSESHPYAVKPTSTIRFPNGFNRYPTRAISSKRSPSGTNSGGSRLLAGSIRGIW